VSCSELSALQNERKKCLGSFKTASKNKNYFKISGFKNGENF
jgi:hypothetical protein